ncbi:MAG: hypothetical protein DI568_03200 [Sphingomonas sp.]|nr:MAG: hypothetical protein DI568_03200 [Sphingomonas sp.]
MAGSQGILVTAAFTSAAIAAPAMAQVKNFDIPVQSVSAGIAQLGRQANVQIVVASKDARGKQGKAVQGRMTTEAALSRLLEDTGLQAKSTGSQTFVIVPVAEAAEIGSADSFEAVQDIVVTAQKREERLIDTPQSVTVVSAQELSRLSATQFRDFANTVPGLTFDTAGAGQSQITLRGVTAGWDVSPTVAIYVDDVPYGSSSAFAQGSSIALDVGLFDVERIEVLRGPQGTLYGASTLGGLLKYGMKTPELDSMHVSARAGIASVHKGGISYDGAAAVNMPMGETVAVRASGYYSRDAGYIDNIQLGDKDVNAADIYGGRIDALFKPTEDLTIRLSAFAQNLSRDGTAIAEYTPLRQPAFGDLNQKRWLAESFDQDFRLVSGTVAYDFGPATLTSISSYQSMNARSLTDYSASYVPYFNSDPGTFGGPYSAVGIFSDVLLRKFTQEVRVGSNGGGRLEWLVGGFYTVETVRSDEHMDLFGEAGEPISPDQIYVRSQPSQFRELAGFFNLAYNVTDALQLSGGVRLAQNRQRNEVIGQGLFAVSTPEGRSKETVTTYLANARYQFNANVTAYARFATGYRPGGPNSINYDPTTGEPFGLPRFESDSLKSYELGLKAQTPGRSFSVDASAYYIDWDNIQIIAVRNGFGVVANASRARIKGAELSFSARPAAGFEFSGAFAYQDAQLADDAPDLGGVDGQRLPAVPKFTAALLGDYTLQSSPFRPTAGATLRFVSDREVDFARSYVLPAYTTFDLRAGVTIGRVDLTAFLRNAFDERGQLGARTYAITGGPDALPVSILQPRTIGLSASMDF